MTPFIEGEITDQRDLILSDFVNITDATITLELANGKVFTVRNAWYAADGNVQTEEGNIQVSVLRGGRPRKRTPARPGLEASTPPGIEIPDELNPFQVAPADAGIPI